MWLLSCVHDDCNSNNASSTVANFIPETCTALATVNTTETAIAEWVRAWDTMTMFEATVCGRSCVRSPTAAI